MIKENLDKMSEDDNSENEFEDAEYLQETTTSSRRSQQKPRLTLSQKIDVIRALENGVDEDEIRKSYNIRPDTVKSIKKDRDRILKYVKNRDNSYVNRKRIREGQYPEVEKALYTWIYEQRKAGIHIPVDEIKLKASEIHGEMSVESGKNFHRFSASNGWLSRFKKRFGIKVFNKDVLKPPIKHKTIEELEMTNPNDLSRTAGPKKVKLPKPTEFSTFLVPVEDSPTVEGEWLLEEESQSCSAEHTEQNPTLLDENDTGEPSDSSDFVSNITPAKARFYLEQAIEFAREQGDLEDLKKLRDVLKKWTKREAAFKRE